ncbi:hypothetical protein DASC09_028310 [Saccharomycopsis crataegensis]|uniref:Uncharacterized protein n=1 Tax=Saccharomycopsis crataegensis TaxID=43959 RepID=A0AAV5QLP6_9ASCO|nr:hypothetical protein DASC09_028310 [Saccharomycopsis crataegensis]
MSRIVNSTVTASRHYISTANVVKNMKPAASILYSARSQRLITNNGSQFPLLRNNVGAGAKPMSTFVVAGIDHSYSPIDFQLMNFNKDPAMTESEEDFAPMVSTPGEEVHSPGHYQE